MTTKIYKIVTAQAWHDAAQTGVFKGSPVDLADGFIHFSDAAQVRETAEKHFAGTADLFLIAFDSDALGNALKWEVSRGGALFPHLYAPLDPALALEVMSLPLDSDGKHIFPDIIA